MEFFLSFIILGLIGLFLGLILGIFSFVFNISKNEKAERIKEVLPGANCGGCGYSGCAALADAIVSGKAPATACPVGGEETSKTISKIMGIEETDFVPMTAFVKCSGTFDSSGRKYEYEGISDCSVAYSLGGGPRECSFGCVGLGSCKRACPFDAIEIVGGVARVDENKCTACAKCTVVCPVKIIEIVPKDKKIRVRCTSHDKALKTKRYCQNGCVGCRLCEKKCPSGAISVIDNVAKIDYEKCTLCGLCQEVCPKKIIITA